VRIPSSHSYVRTAGVAFLALATLVPSAPAAAQQQPLTTQDPQTIGGGQILVRGEFSYARDAVFPLTGLTGNLWQLPVLGIDVGLGPIADLQLTGGPYDELSITKRATAPFSDLVLVPGDSTHAVDDISIGTKIKLVSEGRVEPAMAFRFSVRLPNAKRQEGLGQDTTDFSASLLSGKTIGVLRVLGNIGFMIMSEPTDELKQNDVLTYGAAGSLRITPRAELMGEVNGRWSTRHGIPPVGTESRGRALVGAACTLGRFRYDAGVFVGLTPIDPTVGVSAGVSYVFHAFSP
jgi:hypothetical protein